MTKKSIVRALAVSALCALLGIFHADSANATEKKVSLSVLQFNAWLLRTLNISKDTDERLALMPALLASTQADVMALQEVWSNSDRKTLVRALRKFGYRFSFYVPRGLLLGDGLLIVSKFPLAADGPAKLPAYSHSTSTEESFAEKRPIKVVIQLPNGRKVDFVVTHLGAVSFEPLDDRYDPQQSARQEKQIEELVSVIQSNQRNDALIMAADLNLHYQEYDREGQFRPKFAAPYLSLVQQACKSGETMENSFLAAQRMNETSPAAFTYDQKNPYVAKGAFDSLPSEVEDYILACKNNILEVVDSRIVFQGKLPREVCIRHGLKSCPARLSDHYGVLTKFLVH